MRLDLTKLVTVMRVLEDADGELSLAKGGDEDMAHVEAMP